MKESLYSGDKRVIYRETFDSEDGVRSRGGVPTAVSFFNGIASFNGSSSAIIYQNKGEIKEPKSIRLKIRPNDGKPSTPQFVFGKYNSIIDQRSYSIFLLTTGVIRFAVTPDGTTISSGFIDTNLAVFSDGNQINFKEIIITNTNGTGAIYIDGSLTPTTQTNTLNYFLKSTAQISIGATDSLSNFYGGDIEIAEIYNTALTANEVKNLYENKAYKPFQAHGEILGSELVSNGTFNGNADGWIRLGSSGWTYGTNNLKATNVSFGEFTYIAGSFVVGKLYKVTLTVLNYASGILTFGVGNTGISNSITSNGIFTQYVICAGSQLNFYLFGTSSLNCNVDNISVKEVISTANLILDVNAFDGVIKNRLSGNVATGINLVTNGDFSQGTTGWTFGASWSITNKALVNGLLDGGNGTGLRYANAATIGKYYKITYTVLDYVSGNIRSAFGGASLGQTISANGTYYDYAIADSTTLSFISVGGLTCNFSIDNISVKEIIPAVVNTAVAVRRIGNINSMYFKGSVSKLDCGNYNGLTGNITICAWIYSQTSGEGFRGRVLDNNNLQLGNDSVGNYYFITSNNTLAILATVPNLKYATHRLFCITRDSTGVVNFYLDGILTGTANQPSGTPTTSGGSNIFIGNRTSDNRAFNGFISSVRVFSGLLSTAEISQIYTSGKRLYNL